VLGEGSGKGNSLDISRGKRLSKKEAGDPGSVAERENL